MAELLIKAGANVNITDVNGQTPLMRAADDTKMIELLKTAGAR